MIRVDEWFQQHRGKHPKLGENAAALTFLGGQPAVWLERRDSAFFVCAPPDYAMEVDPDRDIRDLGRYPLEIRINGVMHRMMIP